VFRNSVPQRNLGDLPGSDQRNNVSQKPKKAPRMKHSIQEMKRYVRRRLQRVDQQARDGNYRRYANALLLWYAGHSQREASRTLHVSRTPLRKWVRCYEAYGEAGSFIKDALRSASCHTIRSSSYCSSRCIIPGSTHRTTLETVA
jgi:hypothetical protein